MEMKRRLLYIPVFHIDANLINARQRLPAVNQLEKWFSDGVILIDMSGTARTEAKAGNDGQRDRKANRQIYTMTPALESGDPIYRSFEEALFPNGAQTDSQRNDVKIVAGAAKYQAILVTADGASKSQPGGILGNRDKLKGRVRIVSPDEAVTLVREKILEREDFNQQMAREYGLQLPDWIGRD
jgi:hypothetical protein